MIMDSIKIKCNSKYASKLVALVGTGGADEA